MVKILWNLFIQNVQLLLDQVYLTFKYFSEIAQSFGCLKIVYDVNEFNHYLTLLNTNKMSLNTMRTNGVNFSKEIKGAIKKLSILSISNYIVYFHIMSLSW